MLVKKQGLFGVSKIREAGIYAAKPVSFFHLYLVYLSNVSTAKIGGEEHNKLRPFHNLFSWAASF